MRGIYLLAVCVSLFISLFNTSGQTNSSSAKRFLFIVETSNASKVGAPNIQKLLTTLIQSGMGGLMEKGDTFGLWTFNEQLHAGQVPMQLWDNATAAEQAKQVADFIKNQKFDKEPKMEPVLLPMLSLIRTSPLITVVLITSGKKPIQGTPFDREINEFYKANYRDYQKQKTPFVTMLLAQRGEVRRHSVSPAIGDVKIPKPLPMPEPVTQKPLVSIPPAPAPVEQPTTPPPPPKALVITKAGAKTLEGPDAIKLAEEPEPPLEAPEPAPAPATATNSVAATPIPPASTTVESVVPAAAPVPESASAPQEVAQQQPAPPAAPVDVSDPKELSKPAEPAPVAAAPANPPAPSPPSPSVAVAGLSPAAAQPTVASTPPAPLETSPINAPAPTAVIAETKSEAPADVPIVPPSSSRPTAAEQSQMPVAPAATQEGATAAQTATTPAPPSAPNPQVATTNSTTYLIIGFALVVVAIVVAFLIGRQTGRRPERSLISDWANRQK